MYLLNSISMPMLDKFVVVFIHNILVYSKSVEEHEENHHTHDLELAVVVMALRTW
jgi:hypothetical protein